jgi:CheY-like chemotaxis protein
MNKQSNCILHVEDEESDVFLLRLAFKKAGLDTTLKAVADGQEAIDYLSAAGRYADRQQNPLPCLVLLDLKLPRMHGLEVLAWIRRQPNLKGLVVIMFSSGSQPSDLERAYELGANSFLEKPSSVELTVEIAKLIKAWWLELNRFPKIEDAPPERLGKAA